MSACRRGKWVTPKSATSISVPVVSSGRTSRGSIVQSLTAVSPAPPPWLALCRLYLRAAGTCHLIGLVSPGGVHAHQDHVVALAGIVAAHGIPVCIHALTDGRDTPPKSAMESIRQVEGAISAFDNTAIATVCGRYFAMDRDSRWDRVERAYDLIVSGTGDAFPSPVAALESAYADDITDEFVNPSRRSDYQGMKDGDGVLFANFRADRVRELLGALVDPGFDGFERSRVVSLAAVLGMVAYSDHLDQFSPAIFPPTFMKDTLGDVVSAAGLRQLRAAETEKYPHVTYFFNGGVETPCEGEDRLLVPSPKVATYDLQPEMSAPELTDKLIDAIGTGVHDLIVINYANGDMVGHTGDLEAAKRAVECVDTCIARLEDAIVNAGGTMLIIADHGNCEQMFDNDTGLPHTAHTLNQVPAILVNAKREPLHLADGRLADVAPTILGLIGLDQPDEMTGQSLIR